MVHTRIPLSKRVLLIIVVLGIVAETLSLVLLSRVPIDVGFPPGTSPVVLRVAEIVVLIHYPALVLDFPPVRGRVALFWPIAFLIGFLEITLAAFAIYWSAMAFSEALSRGVKRGRGGQGIE